MGLLAGDTIRLCLCLFAALGRQPCRRRHAGNVRTRFSSLKVSNTVAFSIQLLDRQLFSYDVREWFVFGEDDCLSFVRDVAFEVTLVAIRQVLS